jgi:hypothetical protein
MGFLRRLLGGDDRGGRSDGPTAPPVDQATLDADERARELELARFDQERTNDLVRRQQQYADRSWTPPAQGGERRADDGDSPEG